MCISQVLTIRNLHAKLTHRTVAITKHNSSPTPIAFLLENVFEVVGPREQLANGGGHSSTDCSGFSDAAALSHHCPGESSQARSCYATVCSSSAGVRYPVRSPS